MAEVEHGRNSPLRLLLKKPVDEIVDALDKLGVTADQVTITGLLGNALASIIVAKDNHKPRPERLPWLASTTILLIPKILDLLDGSLARKQGTSNPGLDVASDRISETIADLAIMTSNSKAKIPALTALLTTPLPSLIKAWQESRGNTVSESGDHLVSIGGTYVGRSVLTTASLVFPEIAPHTLSIQTASTLAAAFERIHSPRSEKLNMESISKSQKRLNLLAGLTFLTVAAGITTYSHLRNKK